MKSIDNTSEERTQDSISGNVMRHKYRVLSDGHMRLGVPNA